MSESLKETAVPGQRVLQIGPDKVTVTDGCVVIDTKHEMPDWKVRSFKVVPIYFEDGKYYLAEKRQAQAPFKIQYVLKRWVDGEFEAATIFHVYDAESVAERDGSRRSEKRGEVAWACLLLVYPFLGLLWSKVQHRLNRIGFVPRSITSASIFTEFCLVFAQGVFFTMSLQATARSGAMVIGGMIRSFSPTDRLHLGPIGIPLCFFDIALTLAMILDFIVRYTKYLQDSDWSGGFLEWMLPKFMRSKESQD